LEVAPDYFEEVKKRFTRLRETPLEGLEITWDPAVSPGRLLGTARLGSRLKAFILILKSIDGHLVLRCISHIGRVSTEADLEEIQNSVAQKLVHIGAIITTEENAYDLTVEEDVLLGKEDAEDAKRVAALIRRVVEQANLEEQAHLPGFDELLQDVDGQNEEEGANES
jgi:hypothetical protein